MKESLFNLVLWFASVEILAIIFLPLARRLFDEAGTVAALSRIAATLLFGWVAWWLAWLRLLQFNSENLRLLLLIVSGVWCAVMYRRGNAKPFLPDRAYIEPLLVYLVVVIFFAAIVGQRAAIYDTEKLSDYHFLRACMDSLRPPPPDTWYGGASVNYYYFGYVIFAALGNLTDIDGPTVYNLAVLTVPAMTAAALYVLGRRLGGSRVAGAIAVLFALVLGNFRGCTDALAALFGGGQPFGFWDASRAVEGTITEFPFFSAYLGDLHPHYFALPWVLLSLGIFWGLLRHRDAPLSSWDYVALSLSLGAGYVINAWNYPVLGLMLFTTLLLRQSWPQARLADIGVWMKLWIWPAAWRSGVCAVLGVVLFLPFHIYYHNPGEAPLVWMPRSVATSSYEFLGAWGLVWLPALFGAVVWGWQFLPRSKRLWFWLGLVAAVAALAFYRTSVPMLVFAVFAGGLKLVLPKLVGENKESRDEALFLWILLFFSAFIAVFLENLCFDDIYDNTTFRRGNTVFKFSYLYFVFLPLALAALMRFVRYAYWALLGIAVVAGAVYPVATLHALIARDRQPTGWTLDGAAFIKYERPDEYAAIQWLRDNLLGTDAVLLEKQEGSHAWGGRMAAFSGVNSASNWTNSQAIWRGENSEKWGRHADLEAVYKVKDNLRNLMTLQRYNISHVIVSNLEIESYPLAFEFDRKYPVVFTQDATKIYEIRKAMPAATSAKDSKGVQTMPLAPQ